MGELLDRAFQRRLLADIAELYPRQIDISRSFPDEPRNRLLVNLSYLHEHGLVDFKVTFFMGGGADDYRMSGATITARGLDFLADDGGLSAILGVVTVRLTEDTIKALLVDSVQKSDADDSVKSRLVDKIKGLPAEAVGTIAMSLVQSGLAAAPNAIPLLQRLIGL